MINSISGKVSQISDNAITIDISGLGFEVFVTHATPPNLALDNLSSSYSLYRP